jgi:hypothetical protein
MKRIWKVLALVGVVWCGGLAWARDFIDTTNGCSRSPDGTFLVCNAREQLRLLARDNDGDPLGPRPGAAWQKIYTFKQVP